jgi:hypothetical protein
MSTFLVSKKNKENSPNYPSTPIPQTFTQIPTFKVANHVDGIGPSQGTAKRKNTFKEASIQTTKQKGGLAKQLFENNKNCFLKEQGVTLVESEA